MQSSMESRSVKDTVQRSRSGSTNEQSRSARAFLIGKGARVLHCNDNAVQRDISDLGVVGSSDCEHLARLS